MTKDVKEKIRKELKAAPKKFAVQIESSSEEYKVVVETAIAQLLSNKKTNGIYITMNKPVSMLVKDLQAKQIDTNRLFFIDGITGAPQRIEPNPNVVVLSGPTALTELSIEIAKAHQTKKYDFLFFDALSTILIYNSPKRSLQFSYFLMTKLREYELSGVIIYLKSELERNVFDSVSHLCDKSIRF